MHEDPAPPSDPTSVLIAGCGQLGTEAGLELVAHGHRVHGLRRSAGRLPPELNPISADLSDPSGLAHLPGTEVVLFILTPGSFDDGAYRRAYVGNLRRLLDTLDRRDALPRRLVYVSSTSVYGQADGSWVDETSPTEPSGFSGRRLLEGEALAADSGVEEVVAVRFGGIYGPTRARLLRSVEDGRAVCHDDPPIWTNRIHATDAARILSHLTTLDDPEALYLGVDSEPAPDGEVKRWLARRLEVPEPPASTSPPSLTSRSMRSNKRCSNARLLASGFHLLYPTYREGYQQVLDSRDPSPGH